MAEVDSIFGFPPTTVGGGISGGELRRANIALSLVTPPGSEPVTLSEAKNYCKVDTTDDDALIPDLITAARDLAERYTKRAFVTQTWKLVFDFFPGDESPIEIPKPPLISVASVAYVDLDGVAQTFASTNYDVDTWSSPGRVGLKVGQIWPKYLRRIAGGSITYDAGYGNAAAVPRAIKTAILTTVEHLYENRDGVNDDGTQIELPDVVKKILFPFRVLSA